MNTLHMKYAVEVARAGSINKASEVLLIAQPNLSRSIKELEASLGITIFERSAKGMTLTPDGEEFIGYATAILKQIEHVEELYKNGIATKQRFSVSVPRASYISDAFVQFSKTLGADSAEIIYKETNTLRTISNVLSDEYKLGILRYAEGYDKYFRSLFEEKGLAFETLAEFRYVLLMSRKSRLASLDEIHRSDLESLIEVAHPDPYVPSLSPAQVRREELSDAVNRRIFVFERGSQFELLADNPETFMWGSPIPPKTLDRFGLVQRECVDTNRLYRDVLIYRNDYRLSDIDRKFIKELGKAKRKYLNN